MIPLADIAVKDEFFYIKSVTRNEQFSAHRVTRQLMGIITNNTGGFGDVEKATMVIALNEVLPLQHVGWARFICPTSC